MEQKNPTSSCSAAAPAVKPRVPRGPLFFCLTLMLVGFAFIGIVVRHYLVPPEPDLPAKARALLLRQNQQPPPQPLAKILAEADSNHFPSQKHPLTGKPAPAFTLPDVSAGP